MQAQAQATQPYRKQPYRKAALQEAGVACDKTHLSHVTRSDINPTGAERPERLGALRVNPV